MSPKVYAIAQQKGGSGKTVLAADLAWWLAQQDLGPSYREYRRVLALLDDDPGLIRHPELAHLVSALIDDEQAAFLERG